jgi:hypothetical protein
MKKMRKIYAPDLAVIVLPFLIFLEACNSTPKFPVKSKFLGETINTTVDSEVARYYLESYLQGSRLKPDLDARIDELYKQQEEAIPTREELKKVSDRFSVDFATLFLADRLWADENSSLETDKRISELLNPTRINRIE